MLCWLLLAAVRKPDHLVGCAGGPIRTQVHECAQRLIDRYDEAFIATALNREAVAIFPNDNAITRLVGAMMLEQNDEWGLTRRYMQLEGLQALSDTVPTRLAAVAR